MKSKLFIQSFIASMLLTCSSLGFAQTYIVKSNADTDGATCGSDCTLRQAINAANANAGADTIRFDLDNTLITLGSLLPRITETLHINGANDSSVSGDSDSDSDEIGKVILDGSNVFRVLNFIGNDASSSTVKNIQIDNAHFGIEVNDANNMKIKHNVFNSQSDTAIELSGTTNTVVASNNLFDIAGRAINAENSSYSQFLQNNMTIVSDTTPVLANDLGIRLFESSNNTIEYNNINHQTLKNGDRALSPYGICIFLPKLIAHNETF